MSPLDFIPAPYNLVAKVALPILVVGGAWVVGDAHGERHGRAAIAAKYQPAMQRATAALDLTAARIRATRAEAEATDQANARRVEQAQAQATEETALAYDDQLARARALAADYARRLRDDTTAASNAGDRGRAAGDTRPADAGRPAAGARPVPFMDDGDLLICSENTVKALGWRAWWQKVSAIPR